MVTDDPHHIDDGQRDLIRALYPSLQRFARVVAPAEVDPQDLVQEAFYQVLRRTSLTDVEYPSAYLRKTMVNLASNHRRRLGRHRAAVQSLVWDQKSIDAYPSDVHELLSLKPQARAVVYLRVIEGHSYKEIAAMLGCKESSARATATRALRRLRKTLSEEVPHATA